jgi:hypothetical protein
MTPPRPLDAAYSGADVYEYKTTSNQKIANLSGTGTYSDPVGVGVWKSGRPSTGTPAPSDIYDSTNPAVAAWKGSNKPPDAATPGSTSSSDVNTIKIDDNWTLTPALSRTYTYNGGQVSATASPAASP